MNNIEKARLKYKPKKIKYLLIAETPPKSSSERFFYFENVTTQDSLFLETMKAVYPDITDGLNAKMIRNQKKKFLNKFMNDGFYLIDSLKTSFEIEYSNKEKIRLIKSGQEKLLKEIKSFHNDDTQVLLISKRVFEANYTYLEDNKIKVANKDFIDFPGSGGQKKFQDKFRKALI